ncbi:MAG TPA: hypothetical protein VHS13_09545, partial [Edaphobacter sp.]|nr:hypothetical protein [Edaphobacter sp.]
QQCIRLIFSLFRRTGSAYALVSHFRDEGLLFPQRPLFGPNRSELVWVPDPTSAHIRDAVRVQMVDATLARKSTCRSLEGSRKRQLDLVELPLESTPEKDVGLSLRS